MTPGDYAQAKKYGETAKQKYIEKKRHKKKVTTCQILQRVLSARLLTESPLLSRSLTYKFAIVKQILK